MKSVTIATLALATLATANPIQKRDPGGILICNGPNATGNCTYQVYEMDTCHNLTAPFYQNANTFAPDGENFYCYPHPAPCGSICMSPTGCTFGAVNFEYEHKYNLSAIQWDRLIGSFECHLNTTKA